MKKTKKQLEQERLAKVKLSKRRLQNRKDDLKSAAVAAMHLCGKMTKREIRLRYGKGSVHNSDSAQIAARAIDKSKTSGFDREKTMHTTWRDRRQARLDKMQKRAPEHAPTLMHKVYGGRPSDLELSAEENELTAFENLIASARGEHVMKAWEEAKFSQSMRRTAEISLMNSNQENQNALWAAAHQELFEPRRISCIRLWMSQLG